MLRISCPSCNAILEVRDEHIGMKVGCPKCQQRLQVPKPQNKTVLAGVFSELPEAQLAHAPRKEKKAFPSPLGGAGLLCSGLALLLFLPLGIAGIVLGAISVYQEENRIQGILALILGSLAILIWIERMNRLVYIQ